jgi:phage tail sheath protein FI
LPSYLSPGVYIEEVPSGSASLSAGATAVAAFVGFTEHAPSDDPNDPFGLKPRLVTNWSQFENLYGGFTADAMLPHAVYGYFNNGGSMAYIVRVPNTEPAEEPSTLELASTDNALGKAIEVTTKEPDKERKIAIAIEAAEVEDDEAPEAFNLIVVEAGQTAERYDNVTLAAGDTNVETVVNAASTRVQVATKVQISDAAVLAAAALKPGLFPMVAPAPLPVPVKPKSFAGNETNRTGINGLVIAEDVTMVMVPDLVTAATNKETGEVDLGMWKAVQTALISHCEGQANRMAILDAPPGMSVQGMKEWRSDVAMYDSQFAAMYYPWIKISDPVTDSEKLVPPCGHMAGIWARTDDTRGVWKAPANEVIRGALDVEIGITKTEQGLLNPIGVNCIRPFGTRGIRVWGARTLSSDTDWQYINVRRLFNMIETTILNGTQWVVFEPNDMKLWQGVKRTLNAFLRGLWRDGALFGATADQAFFVKCDAETNPPDSIDQGKLVVEVGIAPVKPAEFVIFRISQFKQTA